LNTSTLRTRTWRKNIAERHTFTTMPGRRAHQARCQPETKGGRTERTPLQGRDPTNLIERERAARNAKSERPGTLSANLRRIVQEAEGAFFHAVHRCRRPPGRSSSAGGGLPAERSFRLERRCSRLRRCG
jgi:hypothetical protein